MNAMMTHRRPGLGAVAVLGALAVALTACGLNRKEQGALIGAGGGAVAGGVIGNQTGSTARGAIIGAVVGGAAGAIIGHQMDQQALSLQQNIPGATVTRVGEGIAVTFASGLLYDTGSDEIRAAAAQNLRALATSLGEYPNTDLVIVGHTDGEGSSESNWELSRRRASAAASYLESQGVLASRVSAVQRGESEPIATNDTEAGRQLNRRVEVAIFANAAARRP